MSFFIKLQNYVVHVDDTSLAIALRKEGITTPVVIVPRSQESRPDGGWHPFWVTDVNDIGRRLPIISFDRLTSREEIDEFRMMLKTFTARETVQDAIPLVTPGKDAQN